MIGLDVSNRALGACTIGAMGLFFAYCVYFDKKRRSDPNFRQKLKEKRAKTKQGGKKTTTVKWPNLKDTESVHQFFMEQIQTGETLLAQGEIEDGIDHMSRAVAICGQPQQLLQVLQQTLQPQLFQLLISRLPAVGESIMKMSGDRVIEDDIE